MTCGVTQGEVDDEVRAVGADSSRLLELSRGFGSDSAISETITVDAIASGLGFHAVKVEQMVPSIPSLIARNVDTTGSACLGRRPPL